MLCDNAVVSFFRSSNVCTEVRVTLSLKGKNQNEKKNSVLSFTYLCVYAFPLSKLFVYTDILHYQIVNI